MKMEVCKDSIDIDAIGDVSGDIALLRLALNENKSTDIKRILLGDMICDRGADDIAILDTIAQLKGSILIAGNHEGVLLDYLTGWVQREYPGVFDTFHGYTYTIQESNIGKYAGLDIWRRYGDDRISLIETIPKDHMELLRSMKLCHIIGDTLFLHAPPSDAVLRLLQTQSPDDINTRWLEVTHALLMSDTLTSSEDRYPEFLDTYHDLRQLFLSEHTVPSQDTDMIQKICDKYQIHRIVHGHMNIRSYPPVAHLQWGGYNESSGTIRVTDTTRKESYNLLIRTEDQTSL